MKITKVEASCHNIPVKLPLDKQIKDAVVFVRVETDEGIAGYGLNGGQMRASQREFINGELAHFLVGKNPLETEKIWNVDAPLGLDITPSVLNNSAIVRWAFSAVDIALWDIKGKYFKQPVYRLLGGSHNPVPAYVTCGFYIYRREELTDLARIYINKGQTKLKMQVCRSPVVDLNIEEARVRAMREGMGENANLMVDAGPRWLTMTQARELARRIEQYNITWFEGPTLTSDDYLPMASLRQGTRIPIAPGGGVPGRLRMYRELIINGAIDVVQPNTFNVGGFTEALKIANLAQAFSLPVAGGAGQADHNMQLIAGVANGWMVEFHNGHTLRDDIIYIKPPRYEKNWLTLPEIPGLGFEPNFAALKEYQEP